MTDNRDTSLALNPKYDAAGLITAVATDAATGELLMLAHMNAEALEATLATGEAHFWSRSRGRLWKKGESSGHVLRVIEARIDCDQDALWLKVEAAGPACHTGERSCFFRRIEDGTAGPRRMRALALVLLLTACSGGGQGSGNAQAPQDLESAAIERGLVRDPDDSDLTGLYARDTDRICVVRSGSKYRIGAYVDYGDRITCSGSGTVERSGETLKVTLGKDGCNFEAPLRRRPHQIPRRAPRRLQEALRAPRLVHRARSHPPEQIRRRSRRDAQFERAEIVRGLALTLLRRRPERWPLANCSLPQRSGFAGAQRASAGAQPKEARPRLPPLRAAPKAAPWPNPSTSPPRSTIPMAARISAMPMR